MQATITRQIELDVAGHYFDTGMNAYPIEAGHIKTSHYDNMSVSWDWKIALELKKHEVIPLNTKSMIRYPDDSGVLVCTKAIKREKEGSLTVFTLVPYFSSED
jgi:hypothetical protein